MARATNSFLRSLIRYGSASPANLAEMQAWEIAAIKEIAENKGADIVSGSVNGSAFSKQTSMTNTEWVAALGDALAHIESGTKPVSRTQARLC